VNALPGPFQAPKTPTGSPTTPSSRSPSATSSGLKDPEAYDEKFKRWRMDDLPIVPERFELEPRDAKSKKQLKEIHKLMQRDDVDRIVNACDAGREGELIFSYIYELAGIDKPSSGSGSAR
jgi:DNA topoisomerase-3